MQTESKNGKKYILMVVYDFSRYSFMSFLREKYEAIEQLEILWTRIQVEKGHPILRIRSDRGREFDIVEINHFYDFKMIKHELPRVSKRKNHVFQESAWVMFHTHELLQSIFLAKATNTTCYTANRQKPWLFLLNF